MWINTPNARLALSARRALRLRRAEGTRLRAVQGTLWVTIDNDPRDIVLDPGEDFVVDTPHNLVVLPLGDETATLDLCGGPGERLVQANAARPAQAARVPWPARVEAWLHERLAPRPA